VRLAIVADTHMPKGGRRLPDPCLRTLSDSDLIIHAGDWTGPSVVEELGALGPPLVGVHGNVDEPAVIRALPAARSIELTGATIAVIHDAGPRRGRVARLRRRFPDADAVVFGHSHLPLLESEGGFQVFNPGSPTERRRAPSHSMGIAHVSAGQPPRFEHLEL
jgi:uncharacterized protein